MGIIPKKPKVIAVPWAVAFVDMLMQAAMRTGGRFRYRAAHANTGQPTRLIGKRGNTPGVARHNRPHLQRYSKKRVVGQFG